jgi:NAD+ kinase
MFRKVAIFVKPTESLAGPLTALISVIRKTGAEVYLDERSAKTLGERAGSRGYTRAELGELCDLAVVLGGDGTMLGVARSLAPFGTPIVGVNAGRLGFITDIVLEDMERLLPALIQGQCTRDVRRMLGAELVRNGECIFSGLAVNDIGVSHGRAGGMVEFIVYVNGVQMASQSADGIICATPTGSTAYSLAAGGPLLAPMLNGVTLVPVAPHTLSNRPIVLPGESSINIEITESRDAVAYFDMQEFVDVQPGDVLNIGLSKQSFTLLHPIEYEYFEILRKKLRWNYMPEYVNRSAKRM